MQICDQEKGTYFFTTVINSHQGHFSCPGSGLQSWGVMTSLQGPSLLNHPQCGAGQLHSTEMHTSLAMLLPSEAVFGLTCILR